MSEARPAFPLSSVKTAADLTEELVPALEWVSEQLEPHVRAPFAEQLERVHWHERWLWQTLKRRGWLTEAELNAGVVLRKADDTVADFDLPGEYDHAQQSAVDFLRKAARALQNTLQQALTMRPARSDEDEQEEGGASLVWHAEREIAGLRSLARLTLAEAWKEE